MSHPFREDPPFGFGELEAAGACLPVRRIDIHARVSGVHAHVSLEQTYVNDRDVALEVIYVFPLPALGAVSSYAFTVDGVTTRGTLHEREEARAIYDQAIAAGLAASSLEEDRPEVMTVRVGNLRPRSIASVTIGMDLILPITDDCAVLRLPLLVGARYVPGRPLGGSPSGDGTARDTDDAPDASRVTPPRVDDPGIRVGVCVDAFGAPDVVGTHALDVERKPDRLRVRITDVLPDGDIVLRFPLRERDSALFCPDPGGGAGTLVVTSCSVLPPQSLPLDVAVLLDRSGSMEGSKLALARRAAIGIIEGLTPRDRMVAIAFDHDVEAPIGVELVQARAAQRRRLCERLANIEANGGTAIAEPLQLAARAFQTGPDPDDVPRGFVGRLLFKRPDRRQVIVLITDGQVANEDQLVAIAARADVEILTVAIGVAANEGLCQRLAACTGGACESAPSTELLAGALDRTLRRLLAPGLEDLELVVPGATLRARVPSKPPRAIPGVPGTVAARVVWNEVPKTVELHAIDPEGKPIQRELPIETVDLPSLRRVWARLRIRDLEDEITATDFPQCLALEDELVTTSLEYGVLSRYTAFVAVDKTAREPARQERVVQPVMSVERRMEERQNTTRAGTVRGKIAYLSPEQVMGTPVGPAADVFAIAVMLHELATLRRLFGADSDMTSLMRIIQDPAPRLPPAYAALQPILERALVKEPRDRFRDAGELAAALAQLPADASGLAELALAHRSSRAVPGPVKARSRAWWITETLSHGYEDTVYAATYAGPLVDPLPDAIVRVARDVDELPIRDPLAIDHPSIARVHGVLAVPDRAQVIEYVPGVDLQRVLQELSKAKLPLSLGQLIALAQDMAAALAAVHARGVVHGSLQPTHFVLATSGHCKLVSHPAAPAGLALPVLPIPLRGLGRFLA